MASVITRRRTDLTDMLFVGLLVLVFALRGLLAGQHVHDFAAVGDGSVAVVTAGGEAGRTAPARPPAADNDHCLTCHTLHGSAFALAGAAFALATAVAVLVDLPVPETVPAQSRLNLRHRPRAPPAS